MVWAGFGSWMFAYSSRVIRTLLADCQLGKTTVNCKQDHRVFECLDLAIENLQFSLCASAALLTEHKRSTRWIAVLVGDGQRR